MFLLLSCIFMFGVKFIQSDEGQYFINGKKAINTVDDRFISVSIDPLILFGGIDFSESTSILANHLKPAYLRISGPSTEFLQFVQNDFQAIDYITDDTKSLNFGPSQWWSLNQWIQKHKLTPIFTLNDLDGTQMNRALLNMTSQMNVDCYWQLGYDCSSKTESQYKNDLKKTDELIKNEFREKNKWKIVGSDINNCFNVERIQDIFTKFENFDGADFLVWNPSRNNFPSQDLNLYKNLITYSKKPAIWTIAKKSESPLDFLNGIEWAKTVGDSAAYGFSVIFRKPKLSELFVDTPAFWITLLHKHLMGNNVLEVKRTSLLSRETDVYAHCTRNQDNYSVRGAVTIMVVNNNTNEQKIYIRVAGTQMKNVEVQSYSLTSPSGNSTETFLNGEKLSMHNLTLREELFTPKLRRAKATTHLTLISSAKSVTFFVLPSARLPICVTNELETSFIYEEIQKVQSLDFPDQNSVEITGRIGNHFSKNTLKSIYKKMNNEFKEAEKYYKKATFKKTKNGNKIPSITEQFLGNSNDKSGFLNKFQPLNQNRFVETNKNLKNNLHESLKSLLQKDPAPKPDLELTSAEITKILSDRAKNNMEKSIGGLETLLEKAFKNKLILKREINMKLLNKKINNEKHATLRKSGEISFEDFEIPEEKSPSEIFAGFADKDESRGIPGLPIKPTTKESIFSSGLLNLPDLKPGLSSLSNFQHKDLFSLDSQNKPSKFSLGSFSNLFKTTSTTVKPGKGRNFVKYIKDDAEDLLDDMDDFNGGLEKYHDFEKTFGDDISIVNSNKYDNKLDDDYGFGEFIINKNGDQDEVDKTITRLEDFLSNDDTSDSNTDLDSYLSRFKRRIDGFSKMNLNDDYPKTKLHPIVKGLLGKNWRKRRNALFEIKSIENSIDGGNDENKLKIIKPSLDYKSGEYSIILPGKSKISLIFENEDTTTAENSNPTCLSTTIEEDLDSTTVISEVEEGNTKENNILNEFKEDNNLVFIKKCMKAINDFITKMYKKINNILK